jgi:arsenate reductase
MKKRVLILCTGNSARSQMAEGLLRHVAGDRFEVESAGTRPSRVRPEAIAVLKELGIEISGHRSKHVDELQGQSFDYVLTVCDNAKESCPVFPGHAKRIHNAFEDPAALQGTEEERLDRFRRVRNEIRDYRKLFRRMLVDSDRNEDFSRGDTTQNISPKITQNNFPNRTKVSRPKYGDGIEWKLKQVIGFLRDA